MGIDLELVKSKAYEEIQEENFRVAVEEYKKKLRTKKWWHALFPWKIVFIRREKL